MVIFSPAGIFTRDAMFWSPSEKLFQGVQGGARLEPPDLLVGQGVLALDGDALAAGLGDDHGDGLARRELGEARDRVDAFARLTGEGIDGAQEHVVADLVEVAPDEKPRPGRRDVVGGGLAL